MSGSRFEASPWRGFLLCSLLLVLAVTGGGVSCSTYPGAGESTQAGEVETVTIARVVDGDTVEISPTIDGIEDLRLIGVDTPEVSGECAPEPLAREAERYTARYEGERVSLELDEERVDRYGRLLGYLYVGETGDGSSLEDGVMLNERLVRRGLAQVATFPPNTKYEEEFHEAQRRAREEAVGIWGLDSDQQRLLADRGNGIGGGC